VTLAVGQHDIGPAQSGLPLRLDRLVLDDGARAALRSVDAPARAEVLDQGRFDRSVRVDDCPDGCWLVLGEGFNPAWSAVADGADLGEPALIDGGFNGWWIPAGDAAVTVELRWTAQRPLTIALLASLIVAVLALALVLRDRLAGDAVATGERVGSGPRWAWAGARTEADRRTTVVLIGVWSLAAGALISPGWALVGAVAGAAAATVRRSRVAELTSLATLAAVACTVTYLERRDAPFPNGGWPVEFEWLHGFGVFAAVALLVAAVLADDADASGYPRSP
jgi:arabinofuranan 3-O-arabinosyltransferase